MIHRNAISSLEVVSTERTDIFQTEMKNLSSQNENKNQKSPKN